jgi:hypothetical protein
MKKLLTTLLFATGISLAVAQDSAPYFLSYQGRVTDGAGLAIGNSTPENRLVRFQIYSSATGGTASVTIPALPEASTVYWQARLTDESTNVYYYSKMMLHANPHL